MGLFGKIFGSSKACDGQDEQEARQALTEIEIAKTTDPETADKLLFKAGKKWYEFFGMGKPLHEEYRELFSEIVSRLKFENIVEQWPTVKEFCWDHWDYPTVGSIADSLAETEAGVVYIYPPEKRRTKNALAELNALYALVRDSEVVLAVAGEEDTFVRKDFVIQSADALDRDSEEVIQDWLDYAKKRGKKTESIVG